MTFNSIFASTTLSDGTLNVQWTERPRGGDNHVEFVRADQVPGHKRLTLRAMWRVGGRAQRTIDEESMPVRKEGLIHRVTG